VPSFTDSLTVENILTFTSQVSDGTSSATAVGTLALTSASDCLQVFTGTVAGQIVQLPNATTVPFGWKHEFFNLSNQLIQINDASGTFLTYMSSQQLARLTLQTAGTVAGVWIIQVADISSGLNRSAGATLYDEFLGNVSNGAATGQLLWGIANNGVNSSVTSPTPVAGHPGVIQFSVANNGNSNASISLLPFLLGTGQVTFEAVVMIPVLGTAAQNFLYQFGFGDNIGSVTADPNNGIFFEYSQAGSTFWRYRAGKASTYTTNNSTVTVVAGSWYKLRFVVNTLDTSIQFFIGPANGGILTLVGSITTNIPVLGVAPFFQMRKSVGGNAVVANVDSALIDFNLVTAR
jgi:hypothetical protein